MSHRLDDGLEVGRRLAPSPANVVDDLKPLEDSHYALAVELYVTAMRMVEGVRAVGQFGSVNTPGVSDLDLLVIVDDEQYLEARDRSRRTTEEIPHGPYILWHPAAIIPVSLVEHAAVLHSFDGVVLHWGEESALGPLSRDRTCQTAIHTAVWNSYFWRLLMGLSGGRQELRKLLLILSNVAQSIACNYRVMDDHSAQQEARQWRQQTRAAVMEMHGPARAGVACRALQEAMLRWQDADWKLQAWWSCYINPIPRMSCLQVEIGGGDAVRFKSSRKECSLSWPARAGQVLRRLRRPDPIELPTLYLDSVLLLRDALKPRLAAFDPYPLPARVACPDAVDSYRDAIGAIRQFSRKYCNDEFTMFGDPFITPFAL